MSNQPKVSVLVTAWNLEDYIARALDSVFAQQCNFDFEVVVADDASNDKTMDILLAYQKRHQGKMRILARDAKVGLSLNYLTGLEACHGEYIAMLDGDDLWIDPGKLRMQVEFLDANPEFVFSAHRFKRFFVTENQYEDKLYPDLSPDSPDGFVIDPDVFNGNWPAHTSTIVLRRSALDLNEMKTYPGFKDTHLVFALLQCGKGYTHSLIGSEYTIRGGGHWNDQSVLQRWRTDLGTIKELLQTYRGSKILKRAHAIFQYCTWAQEYKTIQGVNFARRLWLKAMMSKMLLFNNPFLRPAGQESNRGGSAK